MQKERGCGKAPIVNLEEDDGTITTVEFTKDELFKQAELRGLEPDTDLAHWFFPYCNTGYIMDLTGDLWFRCPRSLVEFNDNKDVLIVAQTAVEWANWIKLGVPQMAFDGEEPTVKMASLVKLSLSTFNKKEYEDIKNKNK